MKWCRFQVGQSISYGIVEDDDRVIEVTGSPFDTYHLTSTRYALSDVKLLAPVIPTTFYAGGLNYQVHNQWWARYSGIQLSHRSEPGIGYRTQNAIIAPDEAIVKPKDTSDEFQVEGELVVVIGKPARQVSKAAALNYVLGYTIGNDVSERTWQIADGSLWRAKNADTFKPMGPWIATGLDPNHLDTTVRINGEVKIAQDFEAFYEMRQAQSREATEDLLVLSTDGKGIVMRQEDLREATQKAAQRASPKLKTRLSPGEKRQRKRMATVASVYTVAPHVRSPESVMCPDEEVPPRPQVENQRVWASVERPAQDVIDDLFAEALRRDPQQDRQWVVLVDGDPHQLARIQAAARRHGVSVTIVIDFIHVLEYLWDAARSLYPDEAEAAEGWVQSHVLKVLQGQSSAVAAGMRRSATLRALSAKRRAAVDTGVAYLLNRRSFLRYDIFLDLGFPIATGVIEGACRHLVKDRMDLTGARWRLQRAEAVLKLRSLRSSGDFEAYWHFHKEQERQRNHLTRYADPLFLDAK